MSDGYLDRDLLPPARGGLCAIAVAVMAWLLLGCGQPAGPAATSEEHTDLRFLEGVMVTDAAITVAPDHYWGPHPRGERWSFRNAASLVVMVHRVPEEELAFRFVPDRNSARFHFMALWDSEPLLDRPGRPAPGGTVLRIGRDGLTRGLHVLTIRRVKRFDDPADRQRHDNGFRKLEWSIGQDRFPLRLKQRNRLRYVANFLSRGLTGSAELQMAGCLFDGPQRMTAALDLDRASSISFQLENRSRAPATFSVQLPGETQMRAVEAGSVEPFEVEVSGRRQEISLEVRGADNGIYLWGAPYLRGGAASSSAPVVLVTLDTTRRDVLSPFGGPMDVTPHIDSFARQATVYDSAHASSPWTLPSHASIFTGLHPSRHGAGVSDDHLSADFDTVAELFKGRGYITAGFAGGDLCSARWGVGQGFSLYRNPEGFETRGDRLTNQVLAFLDRHHGDPFFLFVNYFDPHALYDAPAAFQDRFGVGPLRDRIVDLPVWKDLAGGSVAAWRRVITGEAEIVPEAVDFLWAAYLAEVAFMDYQIGRLLAALRQHGRYDDALIVLVADHGELLGEGGFFSHCCRLDPELIEVPLLVKLPGQRQPHRAGELVSHVDLFSTLLGGAEPPPNDGLHLGPGGVEALRARQVVFMEEHQSRIHPLFENMMIAHHLFGLQRLRTREVVWDGGIECSERVEDQWRKAACEASWSERLDQLGELARTPPGTGADSGVLSEDERRRLEALGYVN